MNILPENWLAGVKTNYPKVEYLKAGIFKNTKNIRQTNFGEKYF